MVKPMSKKIVNRVTQPVSSGALRRDLGVKKGKSLPTEKMETLAKEVNKPQKASKPKMDVKAPKKKM